ncbi:MAG: hypothetical protein WAO35_22000, partial [Terriglobia bacterium]
MMCWTAAGSGSFNPGEFATAGAAGGGSFFADACKTGSEDDGEAGAGEGALDAGAAAWALACRVCKTGSEEEGSAGAVDAVGVEGVPCGASAARGSGASGALGLPSGDGSGAGEAAKDGRSSEGPLAVEVACRVCITGSEADGPAGVEE